MPLVLTSIIWAWTRFETVRAKSDKASNNPVRLMIFVWGANVVSFLIYWGVLGSGPTGREPFTRRSAGRGDRAEPQPTDWAGNPAGYGNTAARFVASNNKAR